MDNRVVTHTRGSFYDISDKKQSFFELKPIIDKIIEINEYIYIYQENKGIQLIDNSKWDELMDKFINWEDINDKEEEEIITEEEESEYLYDYGDKLTENDNLILFDYINYLNKCIHFSNLVHLFLKINVGF